MAATKKARHAERPSAEGGGAALQRLQEAIRGLEADPAMRKGRLVETVLADPGVDWEQIFASLALRGRHRSKRRWRRALVHELLRRHFPRGGAHRGAAAASPAALVAVVQLPAAAPSLNGSAFEPFGVPSMQTATRPVHSNVRREP